MRDEFYITLPSNTHKESKTGNFSVLLPRSIQLEGNSWEVALAEIQYPKTWINFPSRFEMESGQLINTMVIVFVDNTRTLVNIAPGNFETVYQLLNAIAFEISKIKNQSKLIIAGNSSKTFKAKVGDDADAEEFEAENLPLIDRSDAVQSVRFKFDANLNRISIFFDDNFVHFKLKRPFLRFLSS